MQLSHPHTMSIRPLFLSLSIAGLIGLAACGNDDGGAIPDGPVGCAVEANFVSIHDNLLSQPRCANAGCHGDASQGNLQLNMGADAAFTALMGASFNSGATQPDRIVASDPAASWFYLKLSDSSVPGGLMPLGGMLPTCEVQAVEEWINAGAMR